MTVRWSVAVLHLLGKALALGAIVTRSRALSGELDRAGLERVFRADNLWGLPALVLIGTGLWRAFGGLDRGSVYYLSNWLFWQKMGLLLLVLLLELWPMVTFIRWRVAVARGGSVDTGLADRFAGISVVQAVLVVLLVVAAVGMARGVG